MCNPRALLKLLLGAGLLALIACAPGAQPSQSAAEKPASAADTKAGVQPTTMAELAAYTGRDRQEILEEGARKEGALTWYTSIEAENHRPMAEAFMKKYPFIKLDVIRQDSNEVVVRVTEEARAGRHLVDNVGGTYPAMIGLNVSGILQPFTSPQGSGIPAELHAKDGTYVADREVPLGVAFNPNLIPESIAPKTYDDLLNPALKGKLSTQDSSQALQFLGSMVILKGEDFVRKLSQQDIALHATAGTAVLNMMAAGEVPGMFPASLWTTNRQIGKGAPVRWIALEPVPANTGYAAIAKQAPHPHGALLFADFIISDEGQQQYAKNGSGPVRTGVKGEIGQIKDFKRFYTDSAVPPDQYQKTYQQWTELHKAIFIKRTA